MSLNRISYIRNHTLRLATLAGQMVEAKDKKGKTILAEAKIVAKDMALEMNMPEGLESWEGSQTLSEDQIRTFIIAVGVLAKTCEALDHLEDYPYREKIEESLRIIQNL